jgi:hypothetical protein
MSYLYGDSTPTDLKSNFLEFLRDAVDFAVFVLEADAAIRRGNVRIQANTEAMEAEIARLEHFIGIVTRSIREADKGAPDSATSACGTYLERLVGESERASVTAMRSRLSQYVANVEAEESATRTACFKALETLLSPHDPPDTETVTRLVLLQSGSYDATLDGRAAFGLAWTFALAIPEGTMWSAPVRIERIAPNLELQAPQLSGWISKEVKGRPQKLDRHVVTELVVEDALVRMKLRPEPGVETGFDFSVDLVQKKVTGSRTGPSEGDASVGAFDVADEDTPTLVALAEQLCSGTTGLARRELTTAEWRDGSFHEVPSFVDVVESLVGTMAPITREIAKRSLKPSELVLRRMLANDRREEVFVEKGTLREKYESLSPALREFFSPLGFDPPPPPPPAPTSTSSPAPSPKSSTTPSPERAELPRSQRPPPPAHPSSPPTEGGPDSGPAVEVTLTPASSFPPPGMPSPETPPLSEVPAPPESSQNPIARLDKEEASKNVVLSAALE